MHRFSSITGILLCVLALSLDIAWAEEPLQKTTEQFFLLPREGAMTLEHTDGSIHIYGWKEPRVRLTALCRAYTAPRLQQIRVEAKSEPASLAVRTIIPAAPGLFADRSGTIDYTVTVPETAQLKLKLVNGEVTLHGLRGGSADIDLVNGRITAFNCYARVQARSIHGAMDVFYDWWENLPAAFDWAIQHGRLGVRLPIYAHFTVDAETASGRIGNGFKFQPANNGPGQALKAKTAPDAPVSFVLRSGGGNIRLDPTP